MDRNIRDFLIETANDDGVSLTNRIAAAQALATRDLATSVEAIITLDLERSVANIATELGGLATAIVDAGR